MSIHPSAVHWVPSMPNAFGASTGYESEIGSTWLAADGWHACGAGESFGPFKAERDARKALTDFIENGYER